jgi:hypothetical protein
MYRARYKRLGEPELTIEGFGKIYWLIVVREWPYGYTNKVAINRRQRKATIQCAVLHVLAGENSL